MALGEKISHLFNGPRLLNKRFSIGTVDLQLINPSYSMQGEDLVARALLKNELRAGPGFYADLGAFEPCYGSNTYLFYQYGWRGVCVEPNPKMAEHYRKFRADDTFLSAAIGPDGSGYWAEAKGRPAESKVAHTRDDFGPDFEAPVEVPFISLATLFATHAPANGQVDYVSMDLEGFELAALQGNDWSRFRPKVIVIEENTLRAADPLASPTIKFLHDLGYRVAAVLPPNVVMAAG